MKKTLFTVMLLVLVLFVALGVGLFAQGAYEHLHRPLVSLHGAGVQARFEETLPRAADSFHAIV